jgi:hypothetical protein
VSTFPDPKRAELQADLREYARQVIDVAWPLQQRGIVPQNTAAIVQAFQTHLASFEPVLLSNEELVVHHVTNSCRNLSAFLLEALQNAWDYVIICPSRTGLLVPSPSRPEEICLYLQAKSLDDNIHADTQVVCQRHGLLRSLALIVALPSSVPGWASRRCNSGLFRKERNSRWTPQVKMRSRLAPANLR